MINIDCGQNLRVSKAMFGCTCSLVYTFISLTRTVKLEEDVYSRYIQLCELMNCLFLFKLSKDSGDVASMGFIVNDANNANNLPIDKLL